MNINHASDLLNWGETAIVLFTREPAGRPDDKFHIRADGSGWSGNWWGIGGYGPPDKVIIYYRPPAHDSHYGEIFMADYEDTVQSPEQDRYRVKFRGIQQVATTDQTWLDFAGKGQNPAGYIAKV